MTSHKLIKSLIVMGTLVAVPSSFADVICGKVSGGKLRIQTKSSNCSRGYTRIVNTTDLDNDETALNQVYGQGEAGAMTLSASDAAFTRSDVRASSFTVPSDVTTYISAGTTIRSSGACDISGTIIVGYSSPGGLAYKPGTDATRATGVMYVSEHSAGISIGGHAAGNGAIAYAVGGSFPSILDGASGGSGIDETVAKRLLGAPYIVGGGGGAESGGSGGFGTGGFALYCKGALTLSGRILANGNESNTGGGGGGGGSVVLVSQTGISITSAGVIEAKGGAGGGGDSNTAPGGGGAGGIVNLLAPAISNSGTISVAGGTGSGVGVAGTVSSTTTRRAGAGGGGSCLGGGSAGSLNADGSYTGADVGGSGCSNSIINSNPAALIFESN